MEERRESPTCDKCFWYDDPNRCYRNYENGEIFILNTPYSTSFCEKFQEYRDEECRDE